MNKPALSGKYQVVAKIDIRDSQQAVWNLLQNFTDVNWAPGVKESHPLGKTEPGVGAGRHCVLEGFGAIDEYITHWQDGIGFLYTVTPLGPLHQAHSRWWLTSRSPNLTELEVVFSYDLRFGLFGLAMHSLMMRNKLEASLPDTLLAVKKRVEEDRVELINSAAAVN